MPEQIETGLIRTGEIDDIIGIPPHWLVRWGITIFFAVMAIIAALSFIVKYPEVRNVSFNLYIRQIPGQHPAPLEADLILEGAGMEKVAAGQPIILKCKESPFQQFGILKGKITGIGKKENGTQLIKISLPDGLKTDIGRYIPYTAGLSGTADVIIGNIALIYKFLHKAEP